MKKKRVKKQAL